ncbi:uncharacterized protein LOC119743145 isoform X2 [Patiria miniata]|uniref:Uncharacterized protein n=1 Tax=Patiria miniata TaxID=46514 RepID=A0A914BGP7_PATMI|nr:uncharacterized protein LOC119743145 isoform X2 [Patiria miniata]
MVSPLVFLFLLCGEQTVTSMPVYEGRVTVTPSLFDRSQVQDCLSQELSAKSDFPFEIRPGCLHILQHALFPEGTPVDFTQSSDWLSRILNRARVISSEEGLHWLWSLLREDCGSLKGLLASLATHIARRELEESTGLGVSDVTDANDYMQKRGETTTIRSDQDRVEDLARLMTDRPSAADLIDTHVPLPSVAAAAG